MKRIIAFLLCLLVYGCENTYIHRGNDSLKIGDFERAIGNFTLALDKNPLNRDARFGLALAYYGIAEEGEQLNIKTYDLWKKTVKEFQILWNVDSSFSIQEAYSNSLFYLAKSTLSENTKANVLPLINKSIYLDSMNMFSLNLKALILEQMGISEESKDIYVYMITKSPSFISSYINLGNLYWREGDIQSAWDIWSMGLGIESDNRTLKKWTLMAEDSLKVLIELGQL